RAACLPWLQSPRARSGCDSYLLRSMPRTFHLRRPTQSHLGSAGCFPCASSSHCRTARASTARSGLDRRERHFATNTRSTWKVRRGTAAHSARRTHREPVLCLLWQWPPAGEQEPVPFDDAQPGLVGVPLVVLAVLLRQPLERVV